MQIAKTVASRSTCARRHVGAVIVKDKRILATGYNGSLVGLAHCDEVGHLYLDNEKLHCVRTIHAEANALIQAARNGVSVDGAEIYITSSPCWNCFKLIANAGIKSIYFIEDYGEMYHEQGRLVGHFSAEMGIRLEQVEE